MTETIDRFAAILQAKGITIFARIDQQAEAEKVGLSLCPTQLLLFGSPKAGTPLMVVEPTIALDLPLKVLAWETTDAKVWVSYNDPNYLKQRFSLSDELAKNIAIITPLIHQVLFNNTFAKIRAYKNFGKKPTLVIAGRYDWICAPEFSEEIAQAIPNADLRIFENSSHLIRADEPEALLDLITGFLVYKR